MRLPTLSSLDWQWIKAGEVVRQMMTAGAKGPFQFRVERTAHGGEVLVIVDLAFTEEQIRAARGR